jgi:glycosyltransferase involved in cell wall biosynthesis
VLLLPALWKACPDARLIYTPLSMIEPLEIRSYGLGGIRSRLSERLFAKNQRAALNRCDHVVRFTPEAVRALEKYYGLSLEHKALAAVYVSREFDGFAADDVEIQRPEPREILWVGRLIASKNVQFVIRAVAKLKTRTPWRLVICGQGPEKTRLELLAETLGVTDKVHFTGRVESVVPLYRSASIFATGSLLEQYSLTLMEAYAFGIPCIGLRADWTSTFNSVDDQILHGETGFGVSSPEEMAERLDELLDNEELRQRYARTGLARKSDAYSFESYFAQIEGLIQDGSDRAS